MAEAVGLLFAIGGIGWTLIPMLIGAAARRWGVLPGLGRGRDGRAGIEPHGDGTAAPLIAASATTAWTANFRLFL